MTSHLQNLFLLCDSQCPWMHHIRNLGFISDLHSLISSMQSISKLCLISAAKYLLRHLLLTTPAMLVEISTSSLFASPPPPPLCRLQRLNTYFPAFPASRDGCGTNFWPVRHYWGARQFQKVLGRHCFPSRKHKVSSAIPRWLSTILNTGFLSRVQAVILPPLGKGH